MRKLNIVLIVFFTGILNMGLVNAQTMYDRGFATESVRNVVTHPTYPVLKRDAVSAQMRKGVMVKRAKATHKVGQR